MTQSSDAIRGPDAKEALHRQFSRGDCVVLISNDTADEVIAEAIRSALRESQGKPLTVMAPPNA